MPNQDEFASASTFALRDGSEPITLAYSAGSGSGSLPSSMNFIATAIVVGRYESVSRRCRTCCSRRSGVEKDEVEPVPDMAPLAKADSPCDPKSLPVLSSVKHPGSFMGNDRPHRRGRFIRPGNYSPTRIHPIDRQGTSLRVKSASTEDTTVLTEGPMSQSDQPSLREQLEAEKRSRI